MKSKTLVPGKRTPADLPVRRHINLSRAFFTLWLMARAIIELFRIRGRIFLTVLEHEERFILRTLALDGLSHQGKNHLCPLCRRVHPR